MDSACAAFGRKPSVISVSFTSICGGYWLCGTAGCVSFGIAFLSCMDGIYPKIKVPEPVDDIEQLYGQILENVAIQQRLLEDQTQLQQTEMYDYYARWVHQIKTPIAALQLLLETQKKDVAKDAEMILEKVGKENAVLENLLEQQYTQNMEQFSDMEEELFCIEQYVGMALQYQRVKSESKDYVFTQVSVDKMVRTVIRKFAKLMIRKKIPMQYEGCRQQVITD